MSHTYIFRSWKPIWSGRYGLSRVETMFEMCWISLWRRMYRSKHKIQCKASHWSIRMSKCTGNMSKSNLRMWFGFRSIYRKKYDSFGYLDLYGIRFLTKLLLDAAEWNTKYWAMDMGGYQHFNTTQCIEPTGGNYKARCCANTLSGWILIISWPYKCTHINDVKWFILYDSY